MHKLKSSFSSYEQVKSKKNSPSSLNHYQQMQFYAGCGKKINGTFSVFEYSNIQQNSHKMAVLLV